MSGTLSGGARRFPFFAVQQLLMLVDLWRGDGPPLEVPELLKWLRYSGNRKRQLCLRVRFAVDRVATLQEISLRVLEAVSNSYYKRSECRVGTAYKNPQNSVLGVLLQASRCSTQSALPAKLYA